ncbi:MAG: hypothetical protein DRP33_01215 [Thermotogae bacterium]|nr:MAG: hypothetical protein DRP33_01215 [Thermotogota bacterium]
MIRGDTSLALVPSLRVFTFDQLRIFKQDTEVDLSKTKSRKARDLLRYMIVYRRKSVPNEVLCEMFWPGMDYEFAKSNLHSTMYLVKRLLGSNVILSTDSGYIFDPNNEVWVDADEFERIIELAESKDISDEQKISLIEKALDIYKGDFMKENLYEDWVLPHKESYKEMYINALVKLSTIYLAIGDISKAIEKAKIAFREDPFNEIACMTMMKAYTRWGKHTEAIKVYKQLCKLLKKELDIEPSGDLTKLYNDIVSGKYDQRWIIVVESVAEQNSDINAVAKKIGFLLRNNDNIKLFSKQKLGIYLEGTPKSTAENILSRIKEYLKNFADIRIKIDRAR